MRPFFNRLSPPCSGPKRPLRIEPKLIDALSSQPAGGRVGRANSTVAKPGEAALIKADPEAALRWIRHKSQRMILMLKHRPRNLLDFAPREQMKKSTILIGDP